MLEALLTVNPQLYSKLMGIIKDFIRVCERKYRYEEGAYSARMFQPDDLDNVHDYQATYAEKTESLLFNINDMDRYKRGFTVPTGNAYIYFGWFCNALFPDNSYLKFSRFNVQKSKIPADMVHNITTPKYMYFDIQNIHFLFQNDTFRFRIYNDSVKPITAKVYPILYRVASKAALNLTHDYNLFNSSDFVNHDIPDLSKIKEIMRHYKRERIGFIPVEIKDSPDESHLELRPPLDPNYEEFLKSLKGGKCCQFCGTKLVRQNQHYCFACGISVDELDKALNIDEDLKTRNDNERLIQQFGELK